MNAVDSQIPSTEEICEITVYISVNGEATDEEDEDIEPWYKVTASLTRPITPDEMLDDGFICALEELVMDSFHENIAINVLDDFEIETYLSDGRAIHNAGYEPDLDDVAISEVSAPDAIDLEDVPVRVEFAATLGDPCESDRLRLIKNFHPELTPLGECGASMLNQAAEHGEAKACRALIAHGADPALFDHDGRAAIHSACNLSSLSIGSVNVLKVLLKAGAQINQVDLQGRQALHYAALSAAEKTCSFLIEHGAQLDCLDDQGMAPIHHALQRQYTHVLRQLVQAGADVDQLNGNGLSPLQMMLGDNPDEKHLSTGNKGTLWLITQGARVPAHAGTMFVECKEMLSIPVSDITPKVAAVLGGFLPELTELLDDASNPTSFAEMEELRGYAQRIEFDEAVALIDSYRARSTIQQIIAQSKSASPSAN